MRFSTPEIAWHNRDPVYSLDIQPSLKISSSQHCQTLKSLPFLPGVNAEAFHTRPALTYGTNPSKATKSHQEETLTYRIVSAGADSTVVVWRVIVTFSQPAQKIKIDPVAQLTRHENAVNVVRFVPTGEDMFASASVDRHIIIWKRVDEQNEGNLSSPHSSQNNKSPSKPIEEKSTIKGNDSLPMEIDENEVKTVESNMLKVSSKSGNRIALTTLSSSTSLNSTTETQASTTFGSNQDLICEEKWIQWKTFRNHLEDVVDISWSSDGLYILSGSVDNEAILWDVTKGTRLAFLSGHKGWVQGVAIDPLSNYLVTMSCDRILRVFNFTDRKIIHKVEKATISTSSLKLVDETNDSQDLTSFITACHSSKNDHHLDSSTCGSGKSNGSCDQFTSKLFYDYTMQSFARRLFFSPDGEFLLVPSGVIEFAKGEKDNKKDKEKEQKEPPVDGQVISNLSNQSTSGKEKHFSPAQANTPNRNCIKTSTDHCTGVINNNTSPITPRVSMKTVTPSMSKVTSSNCTTPKSTKSKINSASSADPGYINACHLFSRSNLTKPLAYFPLYNNYCHAVRFCPAKFTLLPSSKNDQPESNSSSKSFTSTLPLPYRLVFAIATHNSVLIYDTQHATPIAYLTEIHYTRITDLTWSLDGRLLMISSTDGFVTFVIFDHCELGEPYIEPVVPLTVQQDIFKTSQQNTSPSSSQSNTTVNSQPSIAELFAAAKNKAL